MFMAKKNSYRKTVLENGVTIVTESSPSFYSASIGIWVENGARNETPENNGISHFIEHMLFKGTKKRNAHDIAMEIDSVGGTINAFTSEESTCYYVRVLEEHVDRATDVLSDIFLNSLFDESELEKEKEVILQEIKMVEDTPDDHIHELFGEIFWGRHPLGLPVLGTAENISSFKRGPLVDYMSKMYAPDSIVIAAAGKVDHERLVKAFEASFSSVERVSPASADEGPLYSSDLLVLNKRLEQVHFNFGFKGVSCTDPKRYAVYILNSILGGGMSSRLFQEIRERRGLAYSIYSYLSTYVNAGLIGVYAGTRSDTCLEVFELACREIKRFKEEPLSEEELRFAKEQIKGNVLLGLEGTESMMQRIANNEISFGRDIPVGESLAAIEAVTSDQVIEIARELFRGEYLNLAILGKIPKKDVCRKMEEIKADLGD